MEKVEAISFKELYDYCFEKFKSESYVSENGTDVIPVSGINIRVADGFIPIKAVTKHYVTKDKYRITVQDDSTEPRIIETTDDHTCIRIDKSDYFLENVKASKLLVGDMVSTNVSGHNTPAYVTSVENLGPWNDYVYDLEVADFTHVYYANDILIHNSQFINIAPIVEAHLAKSKKDGHFKDLGTEELKNMIQELDDFIEHDVNEFVKTTINTENHTTQGHNLQYAREYVASEAMFFAKKHYLTHIVKHDDAVVDKFKYSGISVRKAEIPASMKTYLRHIYEDTCRNYWTESQYITYINYMFDDFKTKDFEEISKCVRYSTAKDSAGYLESVSGTGVHARAAQIYNTLLKEFKISDKYESLNVGDVVRFCYVNQDNPFNIDVIGFKDSFPVEFREHFSINYVKMFTKIFMKSLNNYTDVMGFVDYSPNNRVLLDIHDL